MADLVDEPRDGQHAPQHDEQGRGREDLLERDGGVTGADDDDVDDGGDTQDGEHHAASSTAGAGRRRCPAPGRSA